MLLTLLEGHESWAGMALACITDTGTQHNNESKEKEESRVSESEGNCDARCALIVCIDALRLHEVHYHAVRRSLTNH
jgi:hypothetical protein